MKIEISDDLLKKYEEAYDKYGGSSPKTDEEWTEFFEDLLKQDIRDVFGETL